MIFSTYSFQLKSSTYALHQLNVVQMIGFELRISGLGSDPSTHWATTTALSLSCIDRFGD